MVDGGLLVQLVGDCGSGGLFNDADYLQSCSFVAFSSCLALIGVELCRHCNDRFVYLVVSQICAGNFEEVFKHLCADFFGSNNGIVTGGIDFEANFAVIRCGRFYYFEWMF